MIVYVFGNPDLTSDALPLRILPTLQRAYPEVRFEVKDPNEDWDVPEELTIIDTVVGIPQVTVFLSLDAFHPAPNLSLHDFDAYAKLMLLKKLCKLKKINIIGVPPMMLESEAIDAVKEKLSFLSS